MRACGAVAIAACLCACLLAFAGCSAPAGTGSSEGAQDAAATKTVVDAYGRSVEVPSDVQSAATVGSGARFVVYAGGQDKLIAATEMETEPALNRPYAIAYKDLLPTCQRRVTETICLRRTSTRSSLWSSHLT